MIGVVDSKDGYAESAIDVTVVLQGQNSNT